MATPEERFSAALWHAARAWRLALDRRLKDVEVGQAGWTAVAFIAKSPEPLSQSELALCVGVEGATMVSTVDRLVKAGLVERQPSIEDRRVKRVVLTGAGWELYRRFRVEADAFRREMLADIPPEQLDLVSTLLERLRDAAEGAK